MESRTQRVAAARGDVPLDVLIENVQLVNVYTREIYAADIGIAGGYVVFAGPGPWTGPEPQARFDGGGKFATPGLIDAHMHIESSMMSPAGFAAAVLPHGTTTVVADPHEIGNVMGLRGVRYILDATADVPLRVYVQVPSCVPAVPALETAGADFGAAEVAEMFGWERVIGLAEVMDYVGVIQQASGCAASARIRDILDVAHARGTVISGHSPGLSGRDLAAYLVGGPLSDHEVRTPAEILEKLRAGMTVEGKVSSFGESMSAVGKVVAELGTVPPNLVMCTDDIFPEDLLRHGHLDHVVRGAIAAGIPPVDAVRAATLNTAQRHRLYELGALAPGKLADVLLVDNLASFSVAAVFVDGALVAQDGRMRVAMPTARSDVEEENTVHLAATPRPDDFVLYARPGQREARLRVLVLTGGRRGLETMTFPVRDGIVDVTALEGVCRVSVIERHGRNANRSLVPVKGLGLRHGAAASTVAHDSHNLLVAGRNAADMALAAQELVACGGGICCADGGRVTALLPLPIAGLMSPLPVEAVVPLLEKLNAALRDVGLVGRQPVGSLIGLALPVIPSYSVTDMGLVDVDRQVVVETG